MSDREKDTSERAAYFAGKLTDFLLPYPQNFKDFVGDKDIITFGDRILSNELATGYNFATNVQYPTTSRESLIFYSIYMQRVPHLAEVLSRMESEMIVGEKDITFGIKAAKIFGDYTDDELVASKIKMASGIYQKTLESVEASIIFHPTTDIQIIRIINFLNQEAPKIPGGYIDPDTRTTSTDDLKRILYRPGRGFELAVANVFELSKGNLIVLTERDKPIRDVNWKEFGTLLTPKLYRFIIQRKRAA